MTLTKQYNVPIWEQYVEGWNIFKMDGVTKKHYGISPPMGFFNSLNLKLAVWKLDRMANKILDTTDPLKNKEYRKYDHLLLSDFLS